jgi:ElaB/YqjD/DUF883 family membrane-anchored ribosome-binding protein
LRGSAAGQVLETVTEGDQMANEDMIGSNVGGSSVRNEGAHGEEEAWHTAEDLKSAAPAVAKEYAEKAGAVFDEAKERVRTLREDSEDYVRKNPMKAVFTALGVGLVLGLIYKH